MHKKDEVLLNRIKEFFRRSAETLYTDRNYIVYAVRSLKDLTEVIIPHFEKYNLVTKKRADFELFKQIVFIKANNRRLFLENFQNILGLRANLNLGQSEKLQNACTQLRCAHPNIIQVPRPLFTLQEISDPQWLIGFIDDVLHKYS